MSRPDKFEKYDLIHETVSFSVTMFDGGMRAPSFALFYILSPVSCRLKYLSLRTIVPPLTSSPR